MSSSRVFKRLFEVQIIHDYFLTTVDGISFFDKNKEDKNLLITNKLAHRIYDVRDILFIEPVGTTKQRMSEFKLIWKKTALGFMVGTEVSVENVAGEIVYKPGFEIDNTINLTFSLKRAVSFFNGMTNISLRPPLPALYYFTNTNKEELDEMTIPNYLSLPISNKLQAHQPGMLHEMGALVDFGGVAREANQQTDGSNPAHWDDIADKRFVSNADRFLLPHNFVFDLKKSDAITEITFILEDESSTEIKTIAISGVEILEQVSLNFTKVDETDEASPVIPPGFYNLKITAGAGPEIIYFIYLNDEIFSREDLGVIDIRLDEPNSPFSILDASGFLKTRINALNEKILHPVFEIRFKNRKSYWRYNSDVDFSAAEILATAAHLEHVPEKLISLKPKAATQTLVPFINGVSLTLPHPKRPSIKVENERIFSEIFINQSNRLLNS